MIRLVNKDDVFQDSYSRWLWQIAEAWPDNQGNRCSVMLPEQYYVSVG
jgi:hypothetical protein